MTTNTLYTPKSFNLSDLKGISNKTLDMHVALYQGYVKETNRLTERLAEFVRKGAVDHEAMPEFSELTRRMGFEYNGMVLHEYYFEALKRHSPGAPDKASAFSAAATASYGSYEVWKADFTAIAKMRGVGWAICYQNPANGRLSNHWVSLHGMGNVAGFTPVLVIDVWEHAFLLDYAPSERAKYVDACFSNIDWEIVERRLAGQLKRM